MEIIKSWKKAQLLPHQRLLKLLISQEHSGEDASKRADSEQR